MLAQILALMFAAAAAPPAPPATAPTTVSPVDVTSPGAKPPPADAKIDMQGTDDDVEQLVAIWPGTAYQAGLGGRVTLRCLVDVHGLAERCDVAYEAPPGKGFGKAALEMRPTIKLAPPLGPDGVPIAAIKNISVSFKGTDSQVTMAAAMAGGTFGLHNPLQMRKVTMLDFPVWAAAASFDDLAAAYPAKAGDAEGYAVAHCQVRSSGVLAGCQTIKEAPEKLGFGPAATALAAARFRVTPQLAQTRHSGELWVDVPIRFPPPAELAARTVMAPTWVAAFDPKAIPKLFPPEAAANGLTTGRGVARCTVAADGRLTDCAPEPGAPDGLGFSEAAVKLASTMKMNLWSADAEPVEGGVVHIPIRLNLKNPAN
ncbi:hypothetical protein [Phenylobacterium sp.]|jgi:hypothetical protein|uniref:hypothetical protein n=1 Tax=Phenylobacterium sp. TaxID=1871053 RepID=UPI002E37727B|nr:hypothetical protein [Phenylobacterium sp.]HEX3366444.1 hypothetical protein [Phenylobacterium sp.]